MASMHQSVDSEPRWSDAAEVHSLPHSPALPAIAVGRRAYSPTFKAYGTILFLGKVYAQMELERRGNGNRYSVLISELQPTE